jgi:hypothetical protein
VREEESEKGRGPRSPPRRHRRVRARYSTTDLRDNPLVQELCKNSIKYKLESRKIIIRITATAPATTQTESADSINPSSATNNQIQTAHQNHARKNALKAKSRDRTT